MAAGKKHKIAATLVLVLGLISALPSSAWGLAYDEMSLERWAKLGEADRYQLNIADKYYREQNWKIAASEYEKFLSLYEASEGAPYAQLKWSICQVNLRKLNTAIKDGYQSVIDYWPDAPEAETASYLIARTRREMGDVKESKKAYGEVLTAHAGKLVATMARLDLASIAAVENDMPRRVALLSEVAYNTERTVDTKPHCIQASVDLASYQFSQGDFPAGLKALASSYTEAEQPYHVYYYVRTPLSQLMANPDFKAKGLALADAAVNFIRTRIPAAPKDDAEKGLFRQMWYYIAEVQSYTGRPDEVAAAYEQVIRLLGADDDVLSRKAAWLKSIAKRDEARAVFAQFKNQIEGQGQIAYSFREESKYDRAIPIYQNLVAQDAANAGRWQLELARTYRDGGQPKEAIAVYRQCDAFPTDLLEMADCHRRLGEFKPAIGLYQQVLAGHEPSAPAAMLEIARTYEQAGEKEPAIKAFQQVCKRFPKSQHASIAHVTLNDTYKITVTLGGATDE